MSDQMLDIQIVRALNANGSLTRRQIVNRINANSIDVEASIDALTTMGCIRAEISTCFSGQFEYHLKTNFSESDCKRSEHRQKMVMYVSRHGSGSKEIAPTIPGIHFSEGLDRAIWKAANTGRWMTVREIRDILTSVGFRRDDVVKRVQYHINAGQWFDRQAGSRNAQFFMLRNTSVCPEVYGSKPKKEIRGETRLVSALDDAGFFSTSTPAVISSTPGPISAALTQQPTVVGDPDYFPISALSEDLYQACIDQTKLIVKADGTLSEAIWSVLADGEEYSNSDIATLLKQFGYSSSQISPILSKRFAENLLTRRMIQMDGRWFNVYKKAAELPEKYTMQKSVVSAMIEAQQPVEKEVISAIQEVNQVAMKVEKPELFDSRIRIKGVEIDIVDFATLYKELSDSGFVRDMHKTSCEKAGNRLLTTTHVIKGVPFERDELLQLSKQMYNLANRFKLAIVV